MSRSAEKTPTALRGEMALLDELKRAATQVGFAVREEKLLRDVGYRVRSGACRLRDAQLIILDRSLPPAAQIDILAEQLSGRALDDLYLSPAARKLVDRRGQPDDAAA